MSRDDLFLFEDGGVVTWARVWVGEARLCTAEMTRLELLVVGPEADVAEISCCSLFDIATVIISVLHVLGQRSGKLCAKARATERCYVNNETMIVPNHITNFFCDTRIVIVLVELFLWSSQAFQFEKKLHTVNLSVHL